MPAIIVGLYLGLCTFGLDPARELGFTLPRSLICALPAMLVAVLLQRFWPLPTLIYGFGFYFAYSLAATSDTYFPDILGPLATIIHPPSSTPNQPAHSDLFLILSLAILLAVFASFLRRY